MEVSRGSSAGERGNDLGRFYQYIHLVMGRFGGNESGFDYGVALLDLVLRFRLRIPQPHPHRKLQEREQCGRQVKFGARGIAHLRKLAFKFVSVDLVTCFLTMLPGRATVTVHSRPFVGWKTAVGFDVSTVDVGATAGFGTEMPFCSALASNWRFRF